MNESKKDQTIDKLINTKLNIQIKKVFKYRYIYIALPLAGAISQRRAQDKQGVNGEVLKNCF